MLDKCKLMDEEKLKEELVRSVKTLFSKGYVSVGGGNHSFRHKDLVWITPSGYPRSHLDAKDLVLIDMNGKIIKGDLRPSIETPFHTQIYKVRDDINAVSHTHSPYTHALAQTSPLIKKSNGIFSFEELEFPKRLGNITVLEYRQLGSKALAKLVGEASYNSNIMILLDHGVVSLGKCIHEAVFYILLLEEFARCFLVSRILDA